MRFRQFLSEVGKVERDKWNCEYCLEKALQSERNCPLTGAESFNEDVKDSTPDVAAARMKYGFTVKKRNNEVVVEEKKKEKYIIRHGDFEFTECPVPILAEDLMDTDERFANFMIDLVNWSEATGCMPVIGGLLDQSNVYFEGRRIVLNEQNMIEYEKQKEQEEKSKANSKKNSSKKGMGNR